LKNIKQITLLIPLILLILAIIFDGLPYGFFTLLRIVIFISALYYFWLIKNDQKSWLSAIFLLIAILFNPIIPIYLSRPIWFFIDIIVAALYSYLLLVLYKE